ncbi:MAG: peptidoglycan DD-metalloendopeptidase family protein [candidate division WOR-3 bacterium]|nr:peptidoglycan DD-metalloendopeptidase family protein [candidate division WOR-3 bacterium]
MEQVNLFIILRRKNRALRASMPIYVFYLFSGFILVCLVLGILAFFTYSQRIKDKIQAKALAKENQILNEKLGKMETRVNKLKQRVFELAEFDSKLRVASAMDLIPYEIRQMGVGGELSDEPANSNDKLAQAEMSIAELERQVQFQKRSFSEIETYLTQQNSARRHTPSIWPVRGWLSSGFGYRNDPFTGRYVMHKGADIVAPHGTPIVATANGRVCFAGVRAGWGRVVEINHGYGYTSFYGHCQSIRVGYGEIVRRGQIIATVGRTGKATGYHLHYGVKVSGNWVNPLNYILDSRYAETE